MLFDWNAYQAELTKSILEFAKLSPDSLKGYQALSAANAGNSLLGEKVCQLISLVVAVTTRCDVELRFTRMPRGKPDRRSRRLRKHWAWLCP